MNYKFIGCLSGLLLISLNLPAVTTITLIQEDFATGTGENISGSTWTHNELAWVWSNVTGSVSPDFTEVYGSAGCSFRGMPSSHGGFEIFSASSTGSAASGSIWQVAVKVILPTVFPEVWNGNTLSFDMGYRAATGSSSFELYNISDARSVLSQTITGSVGTWTKYTFTPVFSSADAGDTLELRWRDTAANSGNLASGLQVGLVDFVVIPEPCTFSLLATGLSSLACLRRRKT